VYVAELAEPFRVLVGARGVHLGHLLAGHPPDGVEVVHGAGGGEAGSNRRGYPI
jgi:hypothetical protein